MLHKDRKRVSGDSGMDGRYMEKNKIGGSGRSEDRRKKDRKTQVVQNNTRHLGKEELSLGLGMENSSCLWH